MVVGRDTITFPDFEMLNFRYRVVRHRNGAVELENTSYQPDRNGSVPYWRFEADGTFLRRPRLKVSCGYRRDANDWIEHESITWYLRPGPSELP